MRWDIAKDDFLEYDVNIVHDLRHLALTTTGLHGLRRLFRKLSLYPVSSGLTVRYFLMAPSATLFSVTVRSLPPFPSRTLTYPTVVLVENSISSDARAIEVHKISFPLP